MPTQPHVQPHAQPPARPIAQCMASSSLHSQWAHCALVTTALTIMAFAPAAQAAVVASPAANVLVPITTSGIYINVLTGAAGTNTTAGWDINPWGASGLFMYSPNSGGGGIAVTGINFASLSAGTLAGPALSYSTAPESMSAANGWALNSDNYFGFRFLNEGNSQIHYGYGVVNIGASFNAAGRAIVSLFYEDQPGMAITVGAVPEPASLVLMLLGGAGMTAFAARRRLATD